MKVIKGYADGPFGQIHYMTCGKGAAVILLHQAPDSMVQFAPVMRLLGEAGLCAIAADIPGCGMSDTPDHPPTITEYAGMVPAVMDSLGLKKAHLLGHHTGAIIVTEASLLFADRVDKLVLNGPLPLTDDERAYFKQSLSAEKEWAPRWDGSHLTEQWSFRKNAQEQWNDINAFHTHFIHGQLAGATVWYAHEAVMDYKHEDALPRITHPTMILANTGDAIYAQSQRAAQMRPDFEFIALEGGTIDIIDEQPQAWAQAVAAYLKD